MRVLNSLFFKTTAIITMAVFLTVATLEVISYRSIQPNAEAAVAEEATTVSKLIAMQIGGSAKFGNTTAIGEILNIARVTAGHAWIGALVVDPQGNQLFSEAPDGADLPAEWVNLSDQARATGKHAENSNGLLVAEPVFFGAEDVIVAVIMTAWSAEPRAAEMTESWISALMGAISVFVVALLGSSFMMRVWVSKPLSALESAVGNVAKGALDTNVPYTGRKDEVGQIARRLEDFKTQLKAGEQLAIDSAFKSAAFEGSTAPMMVVDSEYHVKYHNPACTSLFSRLAPEINRSWKDSSVETMIGASLKDFAGLEDALDEISDRQSEAMPKSVTIPLGERRLRVKFNAALDAHGNMTGAVVEWSERTDAIQKSALVEAIDTAQVRAEFSVSGKLLSANPNFLKSTGYKETEQQMAVNFKSLFVAEGSVEADPLLKPAVSGRFYFSKKDSPDLVATEGSFVSVKGIDGRPEKSVFVGMDVSAAEAERTALEAQRAEDAEQQQGVVDALGMALAKLSAGDLASNIQDHFPHLYQQLRDDFNATVDSLNLAIGSVAQRTTSIRSETAEITAAADDLSRRTERQAATLEETAAALDELTNSVKSAAEGAQGANDMAKSAQQKAEEGGAVAREAVSAMDGIKSSSQEISKITSVIDDIAFQTNLLALNAGVEAARAGEAGRGFAVVATEVRALAQRSSDAAREINELISSSEAQVSAGVDLVDKTGTALAAIVTSISEISDLVANIATSTREQATGLNEVNASVMELDQVTQQNAAMFEETTAASHALTRETDALAGAVSQFKISGEELDLSQSAGERAPSSLTESDSRSDAPRTDETPIEREAYSPPPQTSSVTPTASQVAAVEGNAALYLDDDEGWEDF